MNRNYYVEEKETSETAEPQRAISHKPDYHYRIAGIVGAASFCVVLPKQYAINLGVGKGDFLKVSQLQDKIIIQKA